MRTGFKCRAYPTPGQKTILNRTFGCTRTVWNTVLQWRDRRWRQERLSTSVSDANAFPTKLKRDPDVIVIEDLNVCGMVRNRRLAKAIFDSGSGEFRRQLQYKCARYGRTLVMIDRWYPSSKTCSSCGYLLDELRLSIRTWICPGCGTLHDRDLNAAQNILAAGLAATACGDGVRHPGSPLVQLSTKQEAQPVRAGLPHRKAGEKVKP